jgi:hypothetical protein
MKQPKLAPGREAAEESSPQRKPWVRDRAMTKPGKGERNALSGSALAK